MKLTEIKSLNESSTYKIGPEWDYVLNQIIECKPLTVLHYLLLAKLVCLWKCGKTMTKVSVAETNPVKADIDAVKALTPQQLQDIARCFKNQTKWPGVMYDYFPTITPLAMSPVMGQGSE